MKKFFIHTNYGVVLCIGGLFSLLSCTSVQGKGEAEAPVVNNNKAVDPAVTAVRTVVCEPGSFEYLIQANGKLRSLHDQVIIAESSGRLIVCHAATGKQFPAGALIAQTDITAARFRLAKAELSRYNSEKEYQSQLLGYEALLKDRSGEVADGIIKKLQISTGLLPAEQDIAEAAYEITKAAIHAPFSGMLADVAIEKGQQVSSGQQLFRIYDPQAMILEVKLLEADICLLKKGLLAELTPVAYPTKRYHAAVIEVNPYIDENGMALVRLKLNVARELFPGMNCSATIKVPSGQTLVVPGEAIVMRNDKPVVFTLSGNRARWNYVKPGRTNGRQVEILEGLKPGQQVIISNNLQLAHDAPVRQMMAGEDPVK
ncbi:MAG: efflux RND transporter periplasmic adaptor subunit [Candidatus Pseudobacter hemicellulosilyticus]|uniref:Efflux RND transporter periplasmic adaptor subunit n=1 Tax=Candidatus Pseudobacter hemicellulosilyticus TaxID=3121375 RepID=A0AAJ5WMX1_9BACT|nr:MAG: efflux RND transporter periplasmic adaptor subunit [Pseudobacter sp.]